LFRFQAEGHKRRPNLALVFLFILCYNILLLLCLFQFFLILSQDIGWEERLQFSFSVLRQEIGWEGRLRNELFGVGWDVKP